MAKFCGKDFLILRGYLISGAWAATTAYTAGAVVSNGGNVYRCVTGGTSAGSGGPTGTTSSITDGTVVWAYVSAVDGTYGYHKIGGMRSNSASINNEAVDVTDKDDTPWKKLKDCGVRSMSLSGSGVFSDDAIMKQVMTDLLTSPIQQFRLISGLGDKFTGPFLLTTGERSGEYNQAEQFSLSFESADAITYTPAT